MNSKQYIFLLFIIISVALLVANLVEYQSTQNNKGPLLGMISNMLLIIGMGVSWWDDRRKSK